MTLLGLKGLRPYWGLQQFPDRTYVLIAKIHAMNLVHIPIIKCFLLFCLLHQETGADVRLFLFLFSDKVRHFLGCRRFRQMFDNHRVHLNRPQAVEAVPGHFAARTP